MSSPLRASGSLGRTASFNATRTSDVPSNDSGLEGRHTTGEAATEPPYADAEFERRQEIADELYEPMSSHARGVPLHQGPLVLRDARAPPDRTRWLRDNKEYNPYSYFECPSNKPSKLPKRRRAPPALWLPRREKDPKGPCGQTGGDAASDKSGAGLAASSTAGSKHVKAVEKPRWDTEHHIMVSQMNPEVQINVREYFDKPIRKESEGVPKVRELYCMNDRQCCWLDEAAPLGESRRTFFDFLGPWNVGGPKDQQKVSYWRNSLSHSASTPALSSQDRARLSLCERLAEMPATESAQFWRDWAKHSKLRVPPPPEPASGKSGRRSGGARKRGGWPQPSSSDGEHVTSPSAKLPDMQTQTLKQSSSKRKKKQWDERHSVCLSKDNEFCAKSHQQYFSSAQFLSGAEDGHPGAFLGLPSNEWRKVVRHVTRFPCGPEGRGPIGRRCVLT